ncbi:hypothetical protein [Blastococcus sp. PRF04-17]|uniref:hypothetical protein n=1 Tax=Blastococcus sp. PRF04-17 TaxID=2933797 RepID=UPI001FF1BDED|nr:hypothetical protein [Blastococcus sp. PRF04-17]UOY00649.1 hypothetical protein MVA48_16875 [Blastococcus sp. PRF04-17]
MSDDPTRPVTARPPVVRRAPRRAPRSFAAALGLTALGALLPGTAFLAAGRRRLGVLTLLAFLALVGGGVWLATGGRRTLVRSAVDTDRLLWIVGGVVLVSLLWAVVVISGYRMLVPPRSSRGHHVLGALVVLVLVVAVAAPAVFVSRLAFTQRELIAEVFEDDGRSATVEDTADPFGDKERVNVLLLGGDGGEGREGVRTDTVIVASTDTSTGDTVLFSLPRNLENLPFPRTARWPRSTPTGSGRAARARACSTRSIATGRPSTPTSSGRPTTRARTS